MFNVLSKISLKKFLIFAVGFIVVLYFAFSIAALSSSPHRSNVNMTSTPILWHSSTPLSVYGHYLLDSLYPISRFLKYKFHSLEENGKNPSHIFLSILHSSCLQIETLNFTFVTTKHLDQDASAGAHRILWNALEKDNFIEVSKYLFY